MTMAAPTSNIRNERVSHPAKCPKGLIPFSDAASSLNRSHRRRKEQPLVRASSRPSQQPWRPDYEQLVLNGQLVLQLHSFEVEHYHGRIADPDDRPYGNGVLLWFEVDDFNTIVARAEEMAVEIVNPRHRNPPDGNGGPNHWECWMRDPDGYTVVVASPYGTADGAWHPEREPVWRMTGSGAQLASF
jgi:hypothetical protein